jgi:hypothetical protein
MLPQFQESGYLGLSQPTVGPNLETGPGQKSYGDAPQLENPVAHSVKHLADLLILALDQGHFAPGIGSLPQKTNLEGASLPPSFNGSPSLSRVRDASSGLP